MLISTIIDGQGIDEQTMTRRAGKNVASLYSTPSRRPVPSLRAVCLAALLLGAFWALGTMAACGRRPVSRPNVLIVVISGLRADHVSAYGYRRGTTPAIDALAATGTLYEQAISPAPWSLTAQASLLTGLYPSEHSAAFDHPTLDESLETLPEKLRASGYATFGVTTDPQIGRANGFFQGMDAPVEASADQDGSPDEGAASAESAFSDWLAGRKQPDAAKPFFAYVSLSNPHLPFNPPGEYRQKFLDQPIPLPRLEQISQYWLPFARQFTLGIEALSSDDLAALVSLYDGEVAYSDYRVGRIVDQLRQKDLLDGTLVVVTADAGEDLGDHGLLSESSRLYDSILRVPLVMHLPGRVESGRRVQSQVQTLDLASLVLAMTAQPADGAPAPEAAAVMPARATAISEGRFDPGALVYYRTVAPSADLSLFGSNMLAVRTLEYKYIITSTQRAALFDLKADPGERTTILTQHADLARELSNRIGPWQASLKAPSAVRAPARAPAR